MVTRKTSLSAPTHPPPPPPNFGPLHSHLDVDTADLPPIPTSLSPRMASDSPYYDLGNPWNENQPRQTQSGADIPSILRPGGDRTIPPNNTDVPDILKPGWSGENTPRSSVDSGRSKDFWESSDDEDSPGKGKGKEKAHIEAEEQEKGTSLPAALQIKRKPVGQSPSLPSQQPTSPSIGFASNNPFRQQQRSNSQQSNEPNWGAEIKGKGKEIDLHNSPPTQRLQTVGTARDIPDAHRSDLPPESNIWDDTDDQNTKTFPPPPNAPPPPIPTTTVTSPFSEQPPLIAVSPKAEREVNPWASQSSFDAVPSPIPFHPPQKQTSEYTDDLLDRGNHDGHISLRNELKALPNAAPDPTSQTSLLEDSAIHSSPRAASTRPEEEYFAPPPGPPPPTKPPRPAIVTKPLSDAEIAQMLEQRNETYQIKHFNWFDNRTKKLRRSSMLTQNQNGPCPLLALVNALILGLKDESQAALDDALRSREQVSLGLIIETLMDELLSGGYSSQGGLPDVEELNRFLIKLRTGMNMNPRFVAPAGPAPNLMDARNSMLHVPHQPVSLNQPGTFQPTQDIKLYSAFRIQILHGWLPEPRSDALAAFRRSAQNYEDAQAMQFGEEELEYKLSNDSLTEQEEQVWQDIISMKNFFRTYPTQLTPYGLNCIKTSMEPGSFAILFRNDHFSTIYKNPRDGNLYTLITDAGYADRDEIIWESLVDISGQQSEFFSGDFHSVSHFDPSQSQTSARRHSNQLEVDPSFEEPMTPQQQQEQHDADFAMALQLQEEEEQRVRRERGQSQTGGNNNSGNTDGSNRPSGGRRSQGNIPIPLRSNNSSTGQEVRPLIPPRNARSRVQGVNRPADAASDDTPPTYEEAARGKPYNPPVGSPLHPQSSATASTEAVNVEGTISSSAPPRPGGISPSVRRSSAYNENYERFGPRSPAYESLGNTGGRFPGAFPPSGNGRYGQSVTGVGRPLDGTAGRQGRADDRDCVVM